MKDSPIQDSTTENSYIQDSATSGSATSDTNASASAPDRPKGPNAAAIVLGLVALAMAALIIVVETTDVPVDWSRVGPGAIAGTGLLFVVLGAVGLVRRRGND